MEPVNSNLESKTCATITSSNCVTWAGPLIKGVCKNASLTQVITQLSSQVASAEACCSGNFPAGHVSCYTGNWVDFYSSIPLTGSGIGYSYTISAGLSGQGNPQYKWTKDGDLYMRGGFLISFTVTNPKLYIVIPMVTLPVTCFPTGWIANQYVLACADTFTGQPGVVNFASAFLEYPTGILNLQYQYSNASLAPMSLDIDFGGTRFNIA